MFYHFPKSAIIITLTAFLLSAVSLVCAQEQAPGTAQNYGYVGHQEGKEAPSTPTAPVTKSSAKTKQGKLTELQKQATAYRDQGVEFQRTGDLDAAMSMYQKAVELYPEYAAAYNDLGIIYEAKGFSDRAEESYQRAIKIDPYFLSAYSNLAMFYENKRQLDKAAFYWQKRFELGPTDDPWKEKARRRLEDIRSVLSTDYLQYSREKEVRELVGDVNAMRECAPSPHSAADKIFMKAKASYSKQDYAAAFKEALDAQQLDQSNKEIEEFLNKVLTEALSR